MKKHINIPIFIPHLGCPNQCVFCNQRFISGVREFDINSVRKTIDEIVFGTDATVEREIAFFGGSFTGIDRNLMIELLKIAKEYLDLGLVDSIRCSTRPDYINREILNTLKEYGVKTVELGLQSSNPEVLSACKRGHSFVEEAAACSLLKEFGFFVVGQMMIGLPNSDLSSEIGTAKFICSVGCDGARIYPTVVFRDTELAVMTKSGVYTPLTENDAISRGAEVLKVFISNSVPVIRIGLCETENLSSNETYLAGPNSSSLGEKIMSRVYLDSFIDYFDNNRCDPDIKIFIAKGCTSKAVGNKRFNINTLKDRYGFRNIKFVETDDIAEYGFRVIS